MNFLKIKLGIFSLLAIFAVSVFLTSCEQDGIDISDVVESEVDQQISEIPTDDATFPTEMEYDQKLVAKIQKDGHELQFYRIGDEDISGIVTLEQVYGDARAKEESHYTSIDDGSTPFDHFIRLTDADVPIPLAIAETAKENALEASGRSTTNLTEPLMLLDENFIKMPEDRGCTDLGYNSFRQKHCGSYVASKPSDIKYCDSGKWTSLSRNSYFDGWREGQTARTKTNVICGTTRIEFFGWYNGRWNLNHRVDLSDGSWTTTVNYSYPVEMRVKRSRRNNSGSFRAYTQFLEAYTIFVSK